MPNRLFYNLFATDGKIKLPIDPSGTMRSDPIYVFGFVGGLYKTQAMNDKGEPVGPEIVVNPQFDTTVISNLDDLRGKAVLPSPRIDMDVGDELYITLTNLGLYLVKDPILDIHSVHIHGGHVLTQIDGVPELSWGVPVTPPGKPAISITYYYKPQSPGTIFYHCHQEASEHVQMGMYGALIIYPSYKSLADAGITQDKKTKKWYYFDKKQRHIPVTATNRNFAYNDINTFFNSDWCILFSDIDSTWHKNVYNQTDFNAVDYKPDFWLINGRAFPDTLLPVKLPTGPISNLAYSIPDGYESYVKVSTGSKCRNIKPDKFLFRMMNLGYQPVPFHVHGWHGLIVGKDSHPMIADMKNPAHHMNFTTLVGSGESYDVLFEAEDKRPLYAEYVICGKAGFPPLKQQVAEAAKQAKDAGTFMPPFPGAEDLWGGIALQDSLQKGAFIPPYDWKTWNYGSDTADKLTYPQFYLAHNHDDYKATNNGAYPGGQLLFIETGFPASDYNAEPPVIAEHPFACGKCSNRDDDDNKDDEDDKDDEDEDKDEEVKNDEDED